MGDQLQPVQPIQKWYTKPKVLVTAAGIGYLLLNKKTRKPAIALAGVAVTVMGITSYKSRDGLSQAIGRAFIPLGASLLWLGLRKKK
jgi:hypothetical protein